MSAKTFILASAMNLYDDLEGCLFHYTKGATACGKILQNHKIRFSNIEALRDPFENRLLRVNAGGGAGTSDEMESADRRAWQVIDVQLRLIAEARIACFSADSEDSGPSATNHGRGWASASMWEHYGENHAGVCLAFDQRKLHEAIQQHCVSLKIAEPVHEPVNYLDEAHEGFPPIQIGVDDSADEVLRKRVRDMFFSKLPDWSSEREYRFVLLGVESTRENRQNGDYVDFGDALLAVILGAKFPFWPEPCVQELLRSAYSTNVKLLKAAWDNGRPCLLDHSTERDPFDFER